MDNGCFGLKDRKRNWDKPKQFLSVPSLPEACLGFPPRQDHPSFVGWLCGNDASSLLLIAYYSVHLISVPVFYRLISPLLTPSAELKNRVASLLMVQIACCEAWLGPKRLSWLQWSFVCDQRVLGMSQAGWSGELFLILTPSSPESWRALWSGRWPSSWKIKQKQPLLFLHRNYQWLSQNWPIRQSWKAHPLQHLALGKFYYISRSQGRWSRFPVWFLIWKICPWTLFLAL